MNRSIRLLLAPAAVVALVAAGCGGGDDDDSGAPAEPGVVLAEDNEFSPDDITVDVGDTVTWRFVGNTKHNVTGPGFESENLKDGEFEHTFDEPGEVNYVCTLHVGMKGTVEVRRGGSGAAP